MLNLCMATGYMEKSRENKKLQETVPLRVNLRGDRDAAAKQGWGQRRPFFVFDPAWYLGHLISFF